MFKLFIVMNDQNKFNLESITIYSALPTANGLNKAIFTVYRYRKL